MTEKIHEVLMKVWHREISADEGYDEIEDCIQDCIAGDYYEGLEEGYKVGQSMLSGPVAWIDDISLNITTEPDKDHLENTDLYTPLYFIKGDKE